MGSQRSRLDINAENGLPARLQDLAQLDQVQLVEGPHFQTPASFIAEFFAHVLYITIIERGH